MSGRNDWVLATEESGFTRHFEAHALPVTFGGRNEDDIRLAGVADSVQIGRLEEVFFVQPGKHSANVRVSGEPLKGSRRLADGDVIAVDTARLECRIAGGRLTVVIKAQITAGDTAPPDLSDLARGSARRDDELEIKPVSFRETAADSARRRAYRPSPAAWITAAAFSVLAVFGWFAFTAKSVEVAVEPPPDELRLSATLLKVRLGDRFLLRSGRHRVEAELEGYYPLDTTIEVGQSPDQSIPLTMTKLPGLVTLTTDPEVGAEVRVDGAFVGTTPLVDTEIVPGTHEVEFSAVRFIPETVSLEVEGGHVQQDLTARLTPNWAPVSVSTDPIGAEVFVDGELAGRTPATLELEAGEHEIEARLTGHNAWRDKVLVEADAPQTLPPITLAPADGRIQLASEPAEASVNVNGEFRGRTPLTLRLAPGRVHEIVLTKAGHEDARRELSVAADSGRSLTVELVAQYGEVAVESDPPDAEILVDGERAGATPANLRLTALEHSIEVRQAGYAGQERSITPRPGFTQSLRFSLEPLDDTTGSGYPRVIRTSVGQELRLVPAGRFMMGSSRREEGRRSNETLREVELSRAFYLGVHEVTNAEFRAVRADHSSGEFNGHSLDGDDQPVVRVTWDEVAQYLNALSIRDSLQPVYEQTSAGWVAVRPLRNGYRLPTEAEWAYAARAAGRTEQVTYPWGEVLPPPDRSGNYADLAAKDVLPNTPATYNDGFPVSAPVSSFPANPVGIFDLGGNVAEWVQDVYVIDVSTPSGEVLVDPLGPTSGRSHVVRGASWRSYLQTDLRLAYRDYSTDSREDLGFRIARNLE